MQSLLGLGNPRTKFVLKTSLLHFLQWSTCVSTRAGLAPGSVSITSGQGEEAGPLNQAPDREMENLITPAPGEGCRVHGITALRE